MLACREFGVVQYVLWVGETGPYPKWFVDFMVSNVFYTDEFRYTYYQPEDERSVTYHDEILVDDYSVFINKNGEIFCTHYDSFEKLYHTVQEWPGHNGGVAFYKEDSIEYRLLDLDPDGYPEYPSWVYTNMYGVTNREVTFDDNNRLITYPRSIEIRNSKGESMFLDRETFYRNYTTSDIIATFSYSGKGWFSDDGS